MIFDLSVGGLDLCTLTAGALPSDVPLHIVFLNADGEPRQLSYGCVLKDGLLHGNALPVAVSRLGASTWSIVGETACLKKGGIHAAPLADTEDNPLIMPFALRIDALP